jgi:S-DNA-T family DNA segregation ATPase FtsK/SpoIIIE
VAKAKQRAATRFSLDEQQRRELWGLTLLALALLAALSFLPPALLPAGERLFPTGNVVGVAGRLLARGTFAVFGVAAVLLPLLPALWAAVAFQRADAGTALRWTVLLAGAALTVAIAFAVLGAPAALPAAGWLGAALAALLVGGFGTLGAALLLAFLFAALCVATLKWNPLRALVGGGRAAWSRASSAAAAMPELVLPARPELHDAAESGLAEEPGSDPDATLLDPPVTKSRAAPPEPLPPDSGDPQSGDLPSAELLSPPAPVDEAANRRELETLGAVLIDKLETFRISGKIVGMTVGPVVTQFEVAPAPGVKVARIASLEADVALALRAPSIRIVAPIPGKGAVGVEVPNPVPETVAFREIIESPEFRRSRARLPLALGKDISGKPYVADLARMPHLLIAGATGSGKSVCINTLITSLVFRHPPRALRFLMVDPKMVELSMYNDLPHLRHPVVTDNHEAASVLKWAVLEMERRYELLSANGVRNILDFNRRAESDATLRSPEPVGEEGDPQRWVYRDGPLPYVVVIIDELADLMMTVSGEVEKPLAILAQKSRAIGIHLVLATQRPSVNVITGLIKANFPSRIAFRVSSKVDSRTILDQNGADALLGNGDMLLLPPGSSDPLRLQGAYLSTEETESLMGWYRERTRLRREAAGEEESGKEDDILEAVRAVEEAELQDAGEGMDPADRDKLFRQAAEVCLQHEGGSTSLLQRRLRIGYGRAARIMDQLHTAGVLGPPDGSKARDVLVGREELDRIAPE